MGYYKRLMIEAMQPKEEPPMEVLLPKGYKMTITPQPWIPVREQLPEEGKPDSILLYLDHRDGYGGQAVGYFLGGKFWLYEDGNTSCDKAGVDATHWMPLPEPPEVK